MVPCVVVHARARGIMQNSRDEAAAKQFMHDKELDPCLNV